MCPTISGLPFRALPDRGINYQMAVSSLFYRGVSSAGLGSSCLIRFIGKLFQKTAWNRSQTANIQAD